MQLTHYGHACVLVDFGPGGDGTRLPIDPGSYSNGFEELRDLDAVLITHGHRWTCFSYPLVDRS